MYEEMASQVEVEELIAFSSEDYYRRIDQLILKYEGRVPEACRAKTVVIRNGIPMRGAAKSDYGIKGNPRVVVCGRIAPTKFILEIMRAMEIVREKLPQAELHIFGATEAVDREYGERVVALAKEEGEHVFFHGMDFEANARLHAFDAYVVLGKNQGCPNALLEALSAGVPSIANDDGGTCEQLLHNKTGLLIGSTDSGELAEAIVRMLSDRSLAKRLGQAGRLHALRQFSMEQMVSGYLAILREEKSQVSVTPSASPSQYSSLNLLEAF
jgi:glycosyltransferase involved in cell wall biosynthesis